MWPSLLGFFLACQLAWASDLPPPKPRPDRPTTDEIWMRQVAQDWNNDEIVTTNPNGNLTGNRGDHLLYNNAGSYKLCHNISSTGAGTTWVCDPSALTAP